LNFEILRSLLHNAFVGIILKLDYQSKLIPKMKLSTETLLRKG